MFPYVFLNVSNFSPRLRTSLTWCGMWHRRHPAWASHRPRPSRPRRRPRHCQWWKKSRWRKRQHLTFGQHLDAMGLVNYIYIWWVVSNMNFIVHFIYGLSSFPMTNSYFSDGWLNHQPDMVSSWVFFMEKKQWRSRHGKSHGPLSRVARSHFVGSSHKERYIGNMLPLQTSSPRVSGECWIWADFIWLVVSNVFYCSIYWE